MMKMLPMMGIAQLKNHTPLGPAVAGGSKSMGTSLLTSR
jgi:hypothetical protein